MLMKKRLLFLLFLAVSLGLQAQSFSENFEHDGSVPDGWTTYNTGTTYKWSVVKYSTFSKYYKGFTGGGTYAIRSNTGRTSASRPAPSSWLVSPEITVPQNGVLNFMMVADGGFNSTSTTPEASRTHFSVLVSEAGADTTSFTNELLTFTPLSNTVWQNYSLDLSVWAGKIIRIAFHDYGNTSGKAYTSNNVYIDNVSVDTKRCSDVRVSKLASPQSGYSAKQPVTVKVFNNGFDASGVKVLYSIDGGTPVSETLEGTLVRGQEVEHVFKDSLELSQGVPHTVKAWAQADADLNHDNDSVAQSVTIDRHLSFPYSMTRATASTDWESSYMFERLGTVYGWSYADDDAKGIHAWSYITPPARTSELVSGWIPLPKGKVGFMLHSKSLANGTMTIQLLDTAGTKVLTQAMDFTSSDDYQATQTILDVPESKDYRVSLTLNSSFSTQLLVDSISLYTPEAVVVKPTAITSPLLSAHVSGESLNLTATFANLGSETAQGLKAQLLVDGAVTAENSLPDIASGKSVSYTFDKALALADGSHTLAVTAQNDTISKSVYFYQPVAYPYQETFEDSATWNTWNTYNADADPIYWMMSGVVRGSLNYAKNGTHAAYISSAAGVEHDDWLISPAINITQAGKQRLSYFYVTTFNAASASETTGLEAYVAKVGTPSELEQVEPLAIDEITDNNVNVYRQGFATIDITEPGLYYVAFHNVGMGHDIVLDDVRLDNYADVAITTASHTAVSDFRIDADTVHVSLQNRGATTLDGLTLNYLVNDNVVATSALTASLQPGDTVSTSYTLAGIFTQPGVYKVSVEAVAPNDAETFNNKWAFAPIQRYENAELPYSEDLDSTAQQNQWKLKGGWRTGSYTSSSAAYNGTGAISHHMAAAAEGDWAYSGGIHIPAGTYDMSFFYRTFLNGKKVSSYGQKFAVYVGKACEPDSMTQLVFDTDTVLVAPNKRYRKVIAPFTIAEDGDYYIGIKCTSTTRLGVLYMDQFAIDAPVTTGLKANSYEADFKDRANEWYHYDPSSQFQQWTASPSDAGTLEVKQLLQAQLAATELPGMMVSPAFEFEKGDTVNLSMGYSIAINQPELVSEEEKAGISMGVYVARANMPDSFSVQIMRGNDLTGNSLTANGKYVIPETGLYYFGIMPSGATNTTSGEATTTYSLRSFGYTLPAATGIREVQTTDGECKVYMLNGVLLGSYASEHEALKALRTGTYIVKNASTVKKVVVK